MLNAILEILEGFQIQLTADQLANVRVWLGGLSSFFSTVSHLHMSQFPNLGRQLDFQASPPLNFEYIHVLNWDWAPQLSQILTHSSFPMLWY